MDVGKDDVVAAVHDIPEGERHPAIAKGARATVVRLSPAGTCSNTCGAAPGPRQGLVLAEYPLGFAG